MKAASENLPGIPEAQELAELQARMLRPAQEVNRDGSFELGWGAGMLCFGLGPYFNAIIIKSTWFSPWTSWVCFLPLLCGAFAPYAVPKLVKRFITWPRTGYVANPNELKLKQLVMLMIFGGALGGCIGLLITLVTGALGGQLQAGGSPGFHPLALKVIKLLVCAALMVYLGRKVIRKRPPLPAAYDAAVFAQGMKQTAAGRKRLRTVRLTLLAMFLGFPLILIGVVGALMYWGKPLTHHVEIHWPQSGVAGLPGTAPLAASFKIDWAQSAMLGFLVVANACLYFMGSGLVLKPHRWKWFVFPVMLLAPILAAPAIPYPARQPELATVFEALPPGILVLGVVWFLSGVIALVLFMRQNPLPAADTP